MVTARRMVEAVEHRKAEIVGFYANVLCLGKPWLSACCLLSALCCISEVPVVTILTGSGVLACTLYVAVPRAAWERLHRELITLSPSTRAKMARDPYSTLHGMAAFIERCLDAVLWIPRHLGHLLPTDPPARFRVFMAQFTDAAPSYPYSWAEFRVLFYVFSAVWFVWECVIAVARFIVQMICRRGTQGHGAKASSVTARLTATPSATPSPSTSTELSPLLMPSSTDFAAGHARPLLPNLPLSSAASTECLCAARARSLDGAIAGEAPSEGAPADDSGSCSCVGNASAQVLTSTTVDQPLAAAADKQPREGEADEWPTAIIEASNDVPLEEQYVLLRSMDYSAASKTMPLAATADDVQRTALLSAAADTDLAVDGALAANGLPAAMTNSALEDQYVLVRSTDCLAAGAEGTANGPDSSASERSVAAVP